MNSILHYSQGAVLKYIFDRCAEESITDEQVARVLAPVLAMIRAGAFDRPGSWKRREQPTAPDMLVSGDGTQKSARSPYIR